MTTDTALAIAVPLVAGFEGFWSHPYRDSGGTWTIGYGTAYLPDGACVTKATPLCTQEQALSWLQDLVAQFLGHVRDLVHVPLSANAEAALTSFAYNEGAAALTKSNVIMFINRNDLSGAGRCLLDWDMVGGKVNAGLLTRRQKEKALLLTPDGQSAPEDTADALMEAYNR